MFACVDDVDGITMVRVRVGYRFYQTLLTICGRGGVYGGTVLKRTLFFMIVMALLNPPRRYWNIFDEQPAAMQRMGSTLIGCGVLRRLRC